MQRSAGTTLRLTITTLLAATLCLAAAQGQTRQTGTLDAEIEGRSYTLITTAKHVPEDAAEGVTDDRQRAIVEKVAGTDQHTATYMVMEAMKVADMVIMPAKLFVDIRTEAVREAEESDISLDIAFSLDPTTLDAASQEGAEVRFYPNGWGFDDYYALTMGGLTLDSVVVLNDTTLAISGTIEGVLSHQSSSVVEHNDADTLAITATFQIDEVAGSQLALDLITGE